MNIFKIFLFIVIITLTSLPVYSQSLYQRDKQLFEDYVTVELEFFNRSLVHNLQFLRDSLEGNHRIGYREDLLFRHKKGNEYRFEIKNVPLLKKWAKKFKIYYSNNFYIVRKKLKNKCLLEDFNYSLTYVAAINTKGTFYFLKGFQTSDIDIFFKNEIKSIKNIDEAKDIALFYLFLKGYNLDATNLEFELTQDTKTNSLKDLNYSFNLSPQKQHPEFKYQIIIPKEFEKNTIIFKAF